MFHTNRLGTVTMTSSLAGTFILLAVGLRGIGASRELRRSRPSRRPPSSSLGGGGGGGSSSSSTIGSSPRPTFGEPDIVVGSSHPSVPGGSSSFSTVVSSPRPTFDEPDIVVGFSHPSAPYRRPSLAWNIYGTGTLDRGYHSPGQLVLSEDSSNATFVCEQFNDPSVRQLGAFQCSCENNELDCHSPALPGRQLFRPRRPSGLRRRTASSVHPDLCESQGRPFDQRKLHRVDV